MRRGKFGLMRMQFAQIKHRYFPEAWRTRCLELLDHADGLFGEELCWSSEKERVRQAILLTDGKKASRVAKDELGAANLVLGVIARLAERQISFGEMHIYRGTLSQEGKSYRAIAEIALRELHENECLNYDSLEERLEQIDAAVRSAG